MLSEEELLNRIRKGDGGAQRELYCRYANAAMAVAMRYVADSEAARDVLQDSFVKILTSIDQFASRGEGSLKSWVLRIVSHESINLLRRNRRLTFTDNLPADVADEPPGDPPDASGVPPGLLQQAIEQLPDGYRTVLNLYVFEQMSHKDIARQLGISPATSASQFFHAKRLLANIINKQLNNRSL